MDKNKTEAGSASGSLKDALEKAGVGSGAHGENAIGETVPDTKDQKPITEEKGPIDIEELRRKYENKTFGDSKGNFLQIGYVKPDLRKPSDAFMSTKHEYSDKSGKYSGMGDTHLGDVEKLIAERGYFELDPKETKKDNVEITGGKKEGDDNQEKKNEFILGKYEVGETYFSERGGLGIRIVSYKPETHEVRISVSENKQTVDLDELRKNIGQYVVREKKADGGFETHQATEVSAKKRYVQKDARSKWMHVRKIEGNEATVAYGNDQWISEEELESRLSGFVTLAELRARRDVEKENKEKIDKFIDKLGKVFYSFDGSWAKASSRFNRTTGRIGVEFGNPKDAKGEISDRSLDELAGIFEKYSLEEKPKVEGDGESKGKRENENLRIPSGKEFQEEFPWNEIYYNPAQPDGKDRFYVARYDAKSGMVDIADGPISKPETKKETITIGELRSRREAYKTVKEIKQKELRPVTEESVFQTIRQILTVSWLRKSGKNYGQLDKTDTDRLAAATWYIFKKKNPKLAKAFEDQGKGIQHGELDEEMKELTKEYLDKKILRGKNGKEIKPEDIPERTKGGQEEEFTEARKKEMILAINVYQKFGKSRREQYESGALIVAGEGEERKQNIRKNIEDFIRGGLMKLEDDSKRMFSDQEIENIVQKTLEAVFS